MGVISVSLPSDGTNADVADYNTPINTIVNAINGNLDATNLAAGTITNAVNTSTAVAQGWNPLTATFTAPSGANQGNREYILNTSSDLTSILSPDMKLRFTRGTTPPTQCADFESTSSHYAQKVSPTGITFTDDFTVEAWVKLESYGVARTVLSRYDGTNGWMLRVGALGINDGRIQLMGVNGGSTNYSTTISQASIPLNRWVHIAAVLDMSAFNAATSPIYIDGALAPSFVQRAGTNPTALVQAGNLQLSAASAGEFFDGEIADVRLWNAARTSTQVRDNMNQQVNPATEANLIGYWKLNGDFTDATTNVNHLTAQNSATATTLDNPMNAKEHAVIVAVTSTTVTVQTGPNCNIPNMTLSSPVYSLEENPFGLPGGLGRNRVLGYAQILNDFSGAHNNTIEDVPGLTSTLTVPAGRQVKVTGYAYDQVMNIGSPPAIQLLVTMDNFRIAADRTQTADANEFSGAQNPIGIVSPTAGLHTFKVARNCNQNGILTTQASSDSSSALPAYLLVELV